MVASRPFPIGRASSHSRAGRRYHSTLSDILSPNDPGFPGSPPVREHGTTQRPAAAAPAAFKTDRLVYAIRLPPAVPLLSSRRTRQNPIPARRSGGLAGVWKNVRESELTTLASLE